jgi:hypothetical protein
MIKMTDIAEFKKAHGIEKNVPDMNLEEYREALKKEAIVSLESHGFIVDSFSWFALAADAEQLDLLIAHLQELRKEMNPKNMAANK